MKTFVAIEGLSAELVSVVYSFEKKSDASHTRPVVYVRYNVGERLVHVGGQLSLLSDGILREIKADSLESVIRHIELELRRIKDDR